MDISGSDFHYLIRVRRYKVGDVFPAITRSGEPYKALIENIQKQTCTLLLTLSKTIPPHTERQIARITVISAMTKGRKMDIVVRQAVESGVFALWPIVTQYSQVDSIEKNTRLSRWRRIADEALQQCGAMLPLKIEAPVAMKSAIGRWNRRGPLFLLHEKSSEKDKKIHSHLVDHIDDLSIMIGSEGGFAPQEVAWLEEQGAIRINLGERVLRAETAVLYGVAAMSTILRERESWTLKQ